MANEDEDTARSSISTVDHLRSHDGEHHSARGTGKRHGRGLIVVASVLGLLAAGSGVAYWRWYASYPCQSSKGVGLGVALDNTEPKGTPTIEESFDQMTAAGRTLPMQQAPLPRDGWKRIGDRYVHDLGDNSFYQLTFDRSPVGWGPTSAAVCRRGLPN